MDLALKSVVELMKQHIISNPKNSMSVCFYGTVCVRCKFPPPALYLALPTTRGRACHPDGGD